MESEGLMPGALMIGPVGAAALALCNLSCHEIPDYGFNFTPYSKEYLDFILAE